MGHNLQALTAFRRPCGCAAIWSGERVECDDAWPARQALVQQLVEHHRVRREASFSAATGPAYALPHWSLPEQGFGFLKKSPMWLSRPTAQITMSLIERYGDASMLEEARRLAGGGKA